MGKKGAKIADDIETIKGTLKHLQKHLQIEKRIQHLVVVGNAKTYGHLVKIKQEHVQDMEWLIPIPGDWHILKNLLAFQSTMEEIFKPL